MERVLFGMLTMMLAFGAHAKTPLTQKISIAVTESGFVPNSVDVKPGTMSLLK